MVVPWTLHYMGGASRSPRDKTCRWGSGLWWYYWPLALHDRMINATSDELIASDGKTGLPLLRAIGMRAGQHTVAATDSRRGMLGHPKDYDSYVVMTHTC